MVGLSGAKIVILFHVTKIRSMSECQFCQLVCQSAEMMCCVDKWFIINAMLRSSTILA